MALSLTSAVKDKVAYDLYSKAYASAATHEQGLIDNHGASVLTVLQQYGQWFDVTTAAAPDAWEPWFVDEICLRIGTNAHPDREAYYTRRVARSMQAALTAYTKNAVTYDPATGDAFTFTTQAIRNHVLQHVIRMKPMFMPDVSSVDAALDAALQKLWNRGRYQFRKRQVRMTLTRSAFTGGTYTHSTKTISGLTSVSTSLAAGTKFYVTGGTGATTGEYIISSTTSTTVVLVSSLGSAADGQTDMAGFYVVVTFDGLESNESFDSISSKYWYHEGDSLLGNGMAWATADQMAAQRAGDAMDSDTPMWFRTRNVGTTIAWDFSPIPDASYTFRGEILTSEPASPTSAADTTPFGKFVAEFLPTMRSMVLDQVLRDHGRFDANLHRQVEDEIESLLPTFQEPGSPAEGHASMDVYGDYTRMSRGPDHFEIGGPS